MSDWREPWRRARERVTDLYGRHVGEPADALSTPALVVDVEALDRNLAAMNAALAGQTAPPSSMSRAVVQAEERGNRGDRIDHHPSV